MLIDWFTVGAQLLNFLILVWLLKRYLYNPILDAIDLRENRIAAELADAAKQKAEAHAERDTFHQKNEEFDRQRADLLAKATEEAKVERQRLLDEARKAADALGTKRAAALKIEAANLNGAVSRKAQAEVFAIARKALSDLGGATLEERFEQIFTRRLKEMAGPAKQAFGQALKTANPGVVRSAFDMAAEQRAAIQQALNETFSADIKIRFETAPDLVGGIELAAGGQKVEWSIAGYISTMAKDVGELLNARESVQ